MILRALFRENNYPLNLVSGIQGSAVLSGSGTKFTSLKVGTLIEIEGYGIIGKILSIESATSLTLDRPINDSFQNKKYWIDLSNYVISLSALSRKIESENEGEAGAITLDKVSMEFYFGESLNHDGMTIYNPIPTIFTDLDEKKRFLIKLFTAKWDFSPEGILLVTNTYQQIIDNISDNFEVNFRSLQSTQIYEGMIDFSSITYPAYADEDGSGEFYNTINFDVVDKLSAISLVQAVDIREAAALSPTITGTDIDEAFFEKLRDASNFSLMYGLSTDGKRRYNPSGDTKFIPKYIDYNNSPKIGDIIQVNFLSGQEEDDQYYALLTFKYLSISADELTYTMYYDCISTKPDFIASTTDTKHQTYILQTVSDATKLAWYDKCFYGVDVYIYEHTDKQLKINPAGTFITVTGDEIVALDGLKIIEAIVKGIWQDIPIINNLKDRKGNAITEFRLPLDYIFQLLDSQPFGKEPLDALSYIANTMNCYVFIDKNGALVLQSKPLYDSDTTKDKTIPAKYISKMIKREFWDKLNDAVQINVSSYIKDTSDTSKISYVDGAGYAYKRAGIKPRNQLTKDLFLDASSLSDYGITVNADGTLNDPTVVNGDQGKILNHYGDLRAAEYLDFYGKRHVAYEISFNKISDEMTSWDLSDYFSFIKQSAFTGDANNGRYFITSLSLDHDANTCDIVIVSISSKVYDDANILIGLMNDTYLSGDSSSSSTASGASIANSTGWSICKIITADYTLTYKESIIYCDASLKSITVILPEASVSKNAEYVFQKIDSSVNTVTIEGTVEDITNPILTYNHQELRVKSDGSRWTILNRYELLRGASITVTADYSLTLTDKFILCDATASNITLTLPNALTSKDVEFIILKTDSSANTITINDAILSYQNQELHIKCDGNSWVTINALTNFRQISGSPEGAITPAFKLEKVYDEANRIWYQACGNSSSDWVRLSSSNKQYSGETPVEHVTPDYVGQICIVTNNNVISTWLAKNIDNKSWINIESAAGATEAWVIAQNFLKQGTTTATTYVTADYVNNKFVTPDLLNGYVTENWISEQGYLVQGSTQATTYVTADYVNNKFVTPDLLNGYATESWVNAKGYLVQGSTSDTTYVTADYVNNKFVTPDLLSGYATEGWVNAKGYLAQGSTPETTYVTADYVNNKFVTSDLLNGYATEGWVNAKGYLVQGSTSATTYVTADYVNNKFVTPDLLSGYATEGWVSAKGYLVQGSTSATTYVTADYVNNKFVTPDLLSGYATEGWVSAKGYLAQGSTPATTYTTLETLADYATQNDLATGLSPKADTVWVNQQGFLKQGTTPDTTYITAQYANNNFVTPDLLNGYATTTALSNLEKRVAALEGK